MADIIDNWLYSILKSGCNAVVWYLWDKGCCGQLASPAGAEGWAAVGELYGNVLVGCDTRTSSSAMKQALIAGLLAAGAKSYDAQCYRHRRLPWLPEGLMLE